MALADKVVSNFAGLGGDREAAIDPAFFMLIGEIVNQVIAMLKNCKKPDEVQKVAQDPGLLQRRLLNNAVRKELGFFNHRKHGDKVIEAVLKTGREATVEEIKAEFDAA